MERQRMHTVFWWGKLIEFQERSGRIIVGHMEMGFEMECGWD
jgi:hypothetical protein